MIRQRIKAGLKRAVVQGAKLGRPKIDSATERKVRKQLAKGIGILKVAKSLGLGTGTVQRIAVLNLPCRRQPSLSLPSASQTG
jgi:DNA invertase Pin-like site-specific DNA recombinase